MIRSIRTDCFPLLSMSKTWQMVFNIVLVYLQFRKISYSQTHLYRQNNICCYLWDRYLLWQNLHLFKVGITIFFKGESTEQSYILLHWRCLISHENKCKNIRERMHVTFKQNNQKKIYVVIICLSHSDLLDIIIKYLQLQVDQKGPYEEVSGVGLLSFQGCGWFVQFPPVYHHHLDFYQWQ